MNTVEYRNLCDLCETHAITDEDSLAVSRMIVAVRNERLTDAGVAAVSAIRARAARAYNDGGPEMPEGWTPPFVA